MSFGRLLTDRRTQKGLTQAQLAERVGVSAQTVYRWEYDMRSPDVEQLKKLCTALDVSPEYFLYGEEEKNAHTSENKFNVNETDAVREEEKNHSENERCAVLPAASETEKLIRGYRRMIFAGIALIAFAVALLCGGTVLLFMVLDLLRGNIVWPGAEGGASEESSASSPPEGGTPQGDVLPSVWLSCVLLVLAVAVLIVGILLSVRSRKKLKELFPSAER